MYSRGEIRHACYRAKNGCATEKNLEILSVVEPLLSTGQRWENFPEVWDVIVTKEGKVQIVYPEKDYDYIHSTLLKASLYDEMNKPFSEMSDREYSLISRVESLLLDSVMTWKNYNVVWGVGVDANTNNISTIMYNVKPTQIEVTQEMIEASKKDADGSAFKPETDNVLVAKPMTDAQRDAFEKFLENQYKG